MTYPPPGDPNQLPPTQPFGAPPPQPYGPPQPQYGQPQPPQFGAPQPGYGAPQPQPGYGAPQPQYGQPGYPPPGFPPPPMPPKKSRTLPIVLVSIAIGLVLCVGGTTVFYLIGKNAENAENSGNTGNTGNTATQISITEPATLGGLAKLDSAEYASITEDMSRELAQYPGASNSFGAFYGSPENEDMVAALATEATIASPQKELDASFDTFSQSSAVTGLTEVATGSLGGVAQCGNSSFSGIDVAVCGWADKGSVGMIMYFFRTNQEILNDFPAMRAEIESKS